MQDQVPYASAALEAGREIEQAEGQAMLERWWRREVLPAIERSRAALRALQEQERQAGPIDTERWRRVARLPVLVRAVPGFADLWAQQVPDDALERTGALLWVDCRCGERHLLPVAEVVMCECGRWFLRTARDVRVKVWPREAAA